MSDYSNYVQRIRKRQQEALSRRKELLRAQQSFLVEVVEFASKLEQSGCIMHYKFPGDNPQIPIYLLCYSDCRWLTLPNSYLAGEEWGLAVFKRGSESSQKIFGGEKCYEEAFTYLADSIAEQTAELMFLQDRQEL